MRTSHNTRVLTNDKNEFCGFFLEADFVAEHESGIAGIQELLNCYHPDKNGIDRRTCVDTEIENVHLFKNKDNYCLFVGKNHQLGYLKDTKNSHNYSKWDDRGFLIVSDSYHNVKLLQEEILKNNVAVFIGGLSDNPFNRGGLTIGIVDRIEQRHKDKMFAQDEDFEKLQKTSQAIGIVEKINSINDDYVEKGGSVWDVPCGYFALQPKWIREDLKHKSMYDVMYWLNPCQQNKNNFGWYTVEELEEWTKGKGPIIKR